MIRMIALQIILIAGMDVLLLIVHLLTAQAYVPVADLPVEWEEEQDLRHHHHDVAGGN